MNVKYIKSHAYEYTGRIFASNLPHRESKPKYTKLLDLDYFSRSNKSNINQQILKNKYGGDGKQLPLTPFSLPAPWPYHPPAIETPPRPVPARLGPSFHDPRTPHVLESHPERAALLFRCDDERRPTVGSHSANALRLHLAACNLSLLSLGPSLLQFVSIVLLLLNNGNPIFPCVSFAFSSSTFAFWYKWTSG